MARADILNILYSRERSPLDFKFEQLQAPPLLSFITIEDIHKLHKLASSIKYASKIEYKYKEIDKIMRNRGFIKFHSGTNRIVYRPLESNDFIVKIAIDRVGLHDNPDEYKNQFLLKPFVTKVFEVSPCGTIGSFERVQPIISREEFISVADNIFELINNNIIGEYVLEDIGSEYFMNWGLRTGFGPVLLDFPYVFKLDGKKLYCANRLPETNYGLCGGSIDYDDGFNNLICTKCGKRYLAKDLKEEGEQIKMFTKGDDVAMKVKIVKGREVIRESEKSTDTIVRKSTSTKTGSNKMKVVIDKKEKSISQKDMRPFSDLHKIRRDEMEERIKEQEKTNQKTITDENSSVSITAKLDTHTDIKLEPNKNSDTIDKNEDLVENNQNVENEILTTVDEDALDDKPIHNQKPSEELLKSYGLVEDDFNEDAIEDKYKYLEDEYGGNTFEKINNTAKQYY